MSDRLDEIAERERLLCAVATKDMGVLIVRCAFALDYIR